MSYPKNGVALGLMKFILCTFIIFLALIWVIPGGSFFKAKVYQIVSGDLGKRGAELRGALQPAYKRVVAGGGFGPLHGADVTEDILPFIPTGTPFNDAVVILKSAGFDILPYPNVNAPPNRNRAKNWYALIARISPFANGIFDRYELYVSLLPPSPGEYTTVSKVAATFYRTSL
ncbi:MAG: hypothetical protein WCD20_19770 [Rhodomicrobium sp.]